jgi:hypothetical protein
VIYGQGNMDWFFVGLGDIRHDPLGTEVTTNIT